MRKWLIRGPLVLALSLFTGLAAASPIGDLLGQLSKSDCNRLAPLVAK